jgi:Na+-transporting methylmalonyl-CoA/oxaloacetate decarboxylase gamma subunit
MKLFGRTLEGFAKVLVILIAVLFVSLGLCGLSLGIESKYGGFFNTPNTPLANFAGFAGAISGIGVVLSFLGILAVVVAWLISAMIGGASRPSKDHVQKLFDADRNDDKDAQ